MVLMFFFFFCHYLTLIKAFNNNNIQYASFQKKFKFTVKTFAQVLNRLQSFTLMYGLTISRFQQQND